MLTPEDRHRVWFGYRWRDRDYAYLVDVSTEPQHFGGVRFYLCCPLQRPDGQGGCRRRVRTLYLPPDGHYFGCRWCHELTYRSVQAPAASRLRQLVGILAKCQDALATGTMGEQLEALAATKGTLHSALAAIEGARRE